MLQASSHLDFPQESLGPERGADLEVQHLDGDRPMMFEILRQVDRGHSAAAKLTLERVAITEGIRKRRGSHRHHGYHGR